MLQTPHCLGSPRTSTSRIWVSDIDFPIGRHSCVLFIEHGCAHLAEPGHLDADGVAALQPSGRFHPGRDTGRGAGGDYVTWLECGCRAEPFDDLVGILDHLLSVYVLSQFVVDPGLDPDVFVASCFVERDEPGPGWLECVPALGPHQLEESGCVEFRAFTLAEIAG